MEAEQKVQGHPDESWSEAERWAWAEIRAGKIADFHARHSKLDRYRNHWFSEPTC